MNPSPKSPLSREPLASAAVALARGSRLNGARRFAIVALALLALAAQAPADNAVSVGFGEVDVTPKLGERPIWIAGFGKGRKATRVHDPIMARAVVIAHGEKKIALVAVDVVGLFLEPVERVRKALPGFTYVGVSSTHNHEGPDTLGLWGPNLFQSGVDPDSMKALEAGIVAAVKAADASRRSAQPQLGTARAPELLHDGREPYVKHDELVALRFKADDGKDVGLVVQWNCHPETLDSRNTELSADFVAATVAHLRERYQCPVVYLTGTVGGLMTSLHVEVKDEAGKALADGTFAKTERYGRLVGKLAAKALDGARPVNLGPIEVRTRTLFLPIENPLYLAARKLGVIERQGYLWTGDPDRAEPAPANDADKALCLRTEVGWLQLGDLDVLAVPGEIYPELILGKVQDPPDAGADFPTAPVEPSLNPRPGKQRLILGLANDEIGYIIPKRQWDEKAPFCYGRKSSQYGEVNSLGATAPLLCAGFAKLFTAK